VSGSAVSGRLREPILWVVNEGGGGGERGGGNNGGKGVAKGGGGGSSWEVWMELGLVASLL
jgi:hypothetical protein